MQHLRALLTWTLALLLVAGCMAQPVRTAAVNFGDQHIDQTTKAARVAFFVHQKLPAGYKVSYLQEVDWDTCAITLTNASPVINQTSGNVTANIVAGVRSASFVFNPITPAPNYTITVTLSRNGTTVASGTTNGVTLAPGPNTANVPVSVNNLNVVTVDHTLVTNDSASAGVMTYGYVTVGSLALPRFNGSTTGGTALGSYSTINGIDIDNAGTAYVADLTNARIVAVPQSGGVPTLVAGVSGTAGYTADGLVGAGTKLNSPVGLVHEASPTGRLTFCEFGSTATDGRIRTILGGYLGTLAGGGAGAAGGNNVDATSLQLDGPAGLCADASGNLFFNEVGIGAVRRILASNRLISTLDSPPGVAGKNFGPICLDRTNNVLYYAVANVIYSLTTPAGVAGPRKTVTTLTAAQLGALAGPGPVTVCGLVTDGNGLLFAAVATDKNVARDSDAKVVRIPVDGTGALNATPGRSIDVIAGNGATVSGVSNDVTARVIDGTTQNLGGSYNNLGIDLHSSSSSGTSAGTLYFGDVKVGAGGTFGVGTGPSSVAIDASNNVWVANGSSNTVTKLSSAGTVLGTFAAGNQPQDIAIDGSGNVWMADYSGNTVTKLSSAGVLIGTFAVGTAPEGIAVDAGGNAWVANYNGNNVTKLSPAGATLGTFGAGTHPTGVAIDALGNAWVANQTSNNVTKLSPAGALLGTFAAGLAPFYPAVDPSGNVWVTNSAAGSVTKLSSAGATLGSYAAGTSPFHLAIDASGNVWTANQSDNDVTELSPSGVLLATVAVGSNPEGIALDSSGTAWATNYLGSSVTKVAVPTYGELLQLFPPPYLTAHYGTVVTMAGNGTLGFAGDGGAATSARLDGPASVAVDAAGNVFIADDVNNRVRKVDTAGNITTFAGTGASGAGGDGGAATSAQLADPQGVAVDAAGNVYIADFTNNKIRKVDTTGTITTFAGTGVAGATGDGGPATAAKLNGPYGLALDTAGNLYIADGNNDKVRKVDTTGTITTFAGNGAPGSTGDGGAATAAHLNMPTGVAVDAAGNLFIADSSNNKVREVSAGIITTFAGTGTAGALGDGGSATAAQLGNPTDIAADALGNLYIADFNNNKVRKVSATGTITTYAGTGTAGASGDNGPASSARLNTPGSVAVDGSGNLYVGDYANARVRKVY